MKKVIRYSMVFLLALCSTGLQAQTYQAENTSYQGTLQNGAVFLNETSDYVTFSISASSASSVTVYAGVQSPYGDKVMNWQVGGQSGTYQLTEKNGTYEVTLGTFSFSAGTNTIRITPNWTWFGVDYIRLTGLNSGGGSGGGGGSTELGGFTVSGTKLLDGYGQPFRMMGANLAYAWYKSYGYSKQMQAMRHAGANAVRVALSDGAKWNKDSYSTIQNIISKAEELNMVLVLEVHDHTGSDASNDLQSAAAYWVEMKDALKGHEHTVIINIANEWLGTWRQYNAFESGYSTAITTIRNAGLKHCLMVDASGWGQEVASLTNRAQAILSADPQHNVIFSIHMYDVAGKPGVVSSHINNVLNQNVALCIGEFAWAHNGEDVDEDAILSCTQEKGVGWLAWSWWGNGSGLGYIDLVNDQYDENSVATRSVNSMSCNWGQKVMNAWKNQAVTCTVFTGPSTSERIHQTTQRPDNGLYYDLLGRPITTPQPGQLYIRNGQKILIR